MGRSKFKGRKPYKCRSCGQSARLTVTKKKTINVHLLTDEGKVLQTTYNETVMDKFKDIQWLSTIDLYLSHTTRYNPTEFLEVNKSRN